MKDVLHIIPQGAIIQVEDVQLRSQPLQEMHGGEAEQQGAQRVTLLDAFF